MGRRYNRVVFLRLTEEQFEILKKKSEDACYDINTYLRLLIVQKPNEYPEVRRLMTDLINEYNHIGVNINQIARNNNSGLYNHNDKVRLFAYLQKLNVSVHEVVKALGN